MSATTAPESPTNPVDGPNAWGLGPRQSPSRPAIAATICRRCDQLDDPDGHGPCPCRAWADSHPVLSVTSKRPQSAALRDGLARARRTDAVVEQARKAVAA